jgi:hypothetical protein
MNKRQGYLICTVLAALMGSVAFGDYIKAGAERVIENVASGQQLRLRVNIGGTPTDSLIVDGDGQNMAAASLGSAATPSWTWSADQDTGLFSNGNNIGFTAGGTERAQIASSGIRLDSGSVSGPAMSFIVDNDTGFYRGGADNVRLSGGGADRWSWGSSINTYTAVLQGPDGSAASPAFSATSDPDTGSYSSGINAWAVATGGTRRINVSSTGSLTVDTGNVSVTAGNVTLVGASGYLNITENGGAGGNVPHTCERRSVSCTTCTSLSGDQCTASEKVMGGGCDGAGVAITRSRPKSTEQGWECSVLSSTTIVSYAMCCDY